MSRAGVTTVIVWLLAGCSPSAIDAVTAGDARPHETSPGDAGGERMVTPAGPGYYTDGAQLRDPSGNVLHVRAVTWWGLDQDFNPHGLGALPLDSILETIAGLNFNTLRMAWSSEMLHTSSPPMSISGAANPDLADIAHPIELLDAVIDRARAHNLNVILSRRRASAGTLTDTWFDHDYDTDDFVADWSTLAARYRDRPNVIGCDLESNLGGKSTWGGDDPTYDWRSAAERAGNAVLAVNPNVLVIIEGVDQAEGASYWPGGNLQGVRTNPVTLTLPNHLVYATQDFPSTISDKPFGGVPWFSAPDYPANLPAVWDANWGYLMREKIAPVFLAAFGTALAATSSDSQWLSSLETYTAQFGMSFAYFALNPQTEMPDVGGIYASFESNALNQPLISALAPMLPP